MPFQPLLQEPAIQRHWIESGAFRAKRAADLLPDSKTFYMLVMLPYPSGRIHMGHVRNYTLGDVTARFRRMQGYEVMHPLGWDSFGLPAENAAIKNGIHPAIWTRANIEEMKGQIQKLGISYDWEREVASFQDDYYRWNQWLFLKMWERGDVFRANRTVNWCEALGTVLANEQVVDGKDERTGHPVTQKPLEQYFFQTTKYADELLACLDGLDWPENVKTMQRHWIGRSEGARMAFDLDTGEQVEVFTTRLDTLCGVTFMALSTEHPVIEQAAKSDPALKAFCDQVAALSREERLTSDEKLGHRSAVSAIHPFTGEKVPVFAANYVLMDYGTGAVMGVPAHDERDFEFAQKYGLAIPKVIESESAWDLGTLVNSGEFTGMKSEEAVTAMIAKLGDRAERTTTYKLKDWGLSRQRYWGTPIPIIHCPEHGAVPVPEKDLPVILPQDCVPDGSGNPLHKHEGFHAGVVCPICGVAARRETDTMDTFVDSSWYYMRYCDPKNEQAMVADGAAYWMPMDQYIGGIEHAILHLLYARFWTKVMRDLGLISVDEPFAKLLTQGMVLNHIYSRKSSQGGVEYFWPAEVEDTLDATGKVTGAKLKQAKGDLPAGTLITYEGVGTMSKSKNNGVDPQDLIEKYGADTARLYTMFTAPPEATLEWNDAAVEGSYRFLRRVWNFCFKQSASTPIGAAGKNASLNKQAKALRREIHTIFKQVDYDYQRMQYNTVVSGAMKMLNALEDFQNDGSAGSQWALREGLGILLRAIYPATPHLTHALWVDLAYAAEFGDLLDAPWPKADETALLQDEIELVLQINGKLRGAIVVPATASREQIERIAIDSDVFQKLAGGQAIKKVIIVPGRLVNVVV